MPLMKSEFSLLLSKLTLPFSNTYSSHTNVVAYKEAFVEEQTSTLCIVMEYADNGDLQSKIDNLKKANSFLPEQEIWSILIKLLTGLATLHKLRIVHRDIKCANIFLTKDGNAKLGDLNVSKIAK